MRTTLQSSLKKDVEKCNTVNDELKRLSDALQDLDGKNKTELAFIASKKSMSKMQELEEFLKETTVVIGHSLSFEHNTYIEQYLSEQVGLGKILKGTQLSSDLATPMRSRINRYNIPEVLFDRFARN
ncbi:hypothetical protein DPMN_064938 [Dreissena polymorpha]|uniref:Uncharacterized protein n=1 Tax=Dreissena polymorpha TaxID=45954 RepID=A0A9D4CE24_DREPO|nr:hypothetical protein DPMN_064938 [Dreissena polymorpha]